MKITIDELRAKMLSTLGEKFPLPDAERIVEVLLWADMAGVPTMGVMKLTGTEPLQDVAPLHAIEIERESPVSVLINAGANPAPLASQIATDYAIEKGVSSGISIAGVHNMFSSTAAQAFYALRIANAGLIGIVQSRTPASTTGFVSIDPLFGTNPIAFAFPTTDEPLVFDMSTSAMMWYGLVLAESHGKDIPVEIAIDSLGNPTTNPTEAMNGALLPFAQGHKAAGLALIVEILAGALPGAAYGQIEGEWGASFIAIDPETLIGRDEFRKRCSDLTRKIKSSRRQTGVNGIRLPGDRSAQCYQESVRTGMVDVEESVLAELAYV